jgi:hypothetical protein
VQVNAGIGRNVIERVGRWRHLRWKEPGRE